MKWIGRILYAFVLFQVGMIVMQQATMKKHTTYYLENGVPLLEENKKGEFIEQYFTATSVKEYIKDPIYEGISNDEKYPMDFSIYNASQDGKTQSIIFYFDDRMENSEKNQIDYKGLGHIQNQENYEKNNTLVYIRIKMFMDNETEPFVYYFPINIKDRMPIELLRIGDNGKFQYTTLNEKNKQVKKEAEVINKIELVIEDYTSSNGTNVEEMVPHTLATFIHNEDATNGKDTLEMDSEKGLLAKNFNGSIKNYDLKESYEDTNLVSYPDAKLLDKYNKLMTKPIVIFSLVGVAVTYLIFFLKPTLAFVERKRDEKAKAVRAIKNELEKNESSDTPNLVIDAKANDVTNNEVEIVEEENDINETEIVEDTIEVENVEVNEEVEKVVVEDLSSLTVAELKAKARDLNLPGYSTLRKAELIELINSNK